MATILVRAFAIAPLDEAAALALMRFFHRQGREDRLRQAYWDHRRMLKTQQELAPSAPLEAAYLEMTVSI